MAFPSALLAKLSVVVFCSFLADLHFLVQRSGTSVYSGGTCARRVAVLFSRASYNMGNISVASNLCTLLEDESVPAHALHFVDYDQISLVFVEYELLASDLRGIWTSQCIKSENHILVSIAFETSHDCKHSSASTRRP